MNMSILLHIKNGGLKKKVAGVFVFGSGNTMKKKTSINVVSRGKENGVLASSKSRAVEKLSDTEC